ncbi:MAG: RDD family protein [Pyrinomonadaceae bacterium]
MIIPLSLTPNLSFEAQYFEPPVNPSGNTVSPIASFWRRLAALIIDSLLLGIVGQIIGWTFSSFWFGIGPYGRFVGFIFIFFYFGLMNSKLGGGQTIGKRVLDMAVTDSEK